MAEKNKYSAPAVERVLEIIEIMVQQNRSFTATEMAAILEVSVNSVFRIFIELERKQYVRKDPADSSYELTPKLYYMGSAIGERVQFVNTARPYLKRLMERTSETAVLTILDENFKTVVVEQMESKRPVKFVSTVGITYNTYVSAMGKCILAHQPQSEIERYLGIVEFTKVTENTITNEADFRAELERIRETGVGYDREESIPGLICAASPVFSAGGKIEGAIGTTGFRFLMEEGQFEKNVEEIKAQAAQLSQALGYIKNGNDL